MALIFTNLDVPVPYYNGSTYIYASSGKGLTVPVAIALAIMVFVIGITLIVILCCVSRKLSYNRMAELTEKMNECIQRHQNTTFAGKEVIVRLSKLQSYIAIEFKRAAALQIANANLMMQQQALLLGAGGFGAGAPMI